jgi:hypothetical protein
MATWQSVCEIVEMSCDVLAKLTDILVARGEEPSHWSLAHRTVGVRLWRGW